MLSQEDREKAKERASKYAPEPKPDKVDATMRMLLLAGVIIAIFTGLAGLSVKKNI